MPSNTTSRLPVGLHKVLLIDHTKNMAIKPMQHMDRKDTPAHSSITLSALSAQPKNPKWVLIPMIPDKYRNQTYDVRKQHLHSGFLEQSSTWIREQIPPLTMGIRAHVTPHFLACSHRTVVDIWFSQQTCVEIFPYPVTEPPSHLCKCHCGMQDELVKKRSHSQTYCPLLPKCSKSCISTSHKPVESRQKPDISDSSSKCVVIPARSRLTPSST